MNCITYPNEKDLFVTVFVTEDPPNKKGVLDLISGNTKFYLWKIAVSH